MNTNNWLECKILLKGRVWKSGLGEQLQNMRFRGAMLWNTLNDDAKKMESVAAFKKEIKTWDGTSCLCTICK